MTLLSEVGADEARRIASRILSERRFQPAPIPRPFAGVLRNLGDLISPVVDALQRAFEAVARWLPGGRAALWTILGGLVVALASLFALSLARRRTRIITRELEHQMRAGALDPHSLEVRADAAEESGDLELAIRLRFKAGLLRLGRSRVIEPRDSITSHEVSRLLRSAEFDRLARAFDEIVYGRRPASPEDAAAARTGWREVLSAAGTS